MKAVVGLVTNTLYFLSHSVLLYILKTIFFLKPIRIDVARQLSKMNSKEGQASPKRDGTHNFFTFGRVQGTGCFIGAKKKIGKNFTFLVIVN